MTYSINICFTPGARSPSQVGKGLEKWSEAENIQRHESTDVLTPQEKSNEVGRETRRALCQPRKARWDWEERGIQPGQDAHRGGDLASP